MAKIFCLFALCFIVSSSICAADESPAKTAKETIYYDVNPAGDSVYENFGTVELAGQQVNLTVFKTKVLNFSDTEKIYGDLVTGLPVRVEREVAFWPAKPEYLTEIYSPQTNSVHIEKFKDNKLVQKYDFKGNAPLDNAVIVPFSLRRAPVLEPGWTTKITLPEQYTVKLDGLEEVSVPAGKFKAYHFSSTPEKFEVWISADKLRLPVKIKGLGGLGYTLVMKKYVSDTDIPARQ